MLICRLTTVLTIRVIFLSFRVLGRKVFKYFEFVFLSNTSRVAKIVLSCTNTVDNNLSNMSSGLNYLESKKKKITTVVKLKFEQRNSRLWVFWLEHFGHFCNFCKYKNIKKMFFFSCFIQKICLMKLWNCGIIFLSFAILDF